MTTNIVETLPWIDYREVFDKLEERGRAEGEAIGRVEGEAIGKTEGRTEAQMELAVKAFTRLGRGKGSVEVTQMLKDLEIPASIIEAAKGEADRIRQERSRPESGR